MYFCPEMNHTIEIIRLVAVVLITFTHTRHNIESGPVYVLLEEVPKYGTLLLSIISGYLFWTRSRKEPNLFEKKVKSLAIPYLLANASVLLLVVLIYFLLGFNYLNRLGMDYQLLTEGLFAFNGPPINPPTYFVRDIFIVFIWMDVLFNKRWKLLLLLIPFLFFGKMLLRYDILALFILGMLLGLQTDKKHSRTITALLLLLSLASVIWFPAWSKYPLAAFLFTFLMSFNLRFRKTGGFTYLLHLYHSPVMVMSYPLLARFVHHPILNLSLQLMLAFLFAGLLYRASRRWNSLKILSGGR